MPYKCNLTLNITDHVAGLLSHDLSYKYKIMILIIVSYRFRKAMFSVSEQMFVHGWNIIKLN